MPTPFSHLAIAQRLLGDEQLAIRHRNALNAHAPAFFLGSVAADARIPAPDSRAATHFYTYTQAHIGEVWRDMMRAHPALLRPHSPEQRAFVGGYVAHLGVDEHWSVAMLAPHFAKATWGEDIRHRFFVLHLLLADMDARDRSSLPDSVAHTLRQSQPNAWLPFMSDAVLDDWRDLIADQLENGSQTYQILGERVGLTEEGFRALMEDDATMQRLLWHNIPIALVHEIEEGMVALARAQLCAYLEETETV
jgi:hypothetical protein